MDWDGVTFGAFLGVAGTFGMLALAFYPVMRRTFLLWNAVRTFAFCLMGLALFPVELPAFFPTGEARIDHAATPGPPVLAIPATAILEGHGSTANVYLVDEKTMTATQKRIGIGRVSGEEVIVEQGLDEGDRVVSAGAPYLRDGAKIRIVTDLKAARAESAAPEVARP